MQDPRQPGGIRQPAAGGKAAVEVAGLSLTFQTGDGPVYALRADAGGGLLVAGNFTTAGGVAAPGLAYGFVVVAPYGFAAELGAAAGAP